MEYLVVPTKDKTESAFFLDLLKRMDKNATVLSMEKMEDLAFIAAIKKGKKSGKGSLEKVKAHLVKVSGQP